MFKVTTVLIDEIPNDTINIGLCPTQPVLNSRLNIEHSPTVKLCWVHFPYLVLLTMLTTVDGSKDESLGMKGETVQLTRVGQLEDSLTDFNRSTVHFIQEEGDWLIASLLEPIGRIKSSAFPVDNWKTNKVTLSHLRSTTLHNGKTHSRCGLIDNARLTNTVTTTKQDGLFNCCHQWGNLSKCFEINSHFLLSP